MEKSIIAHQLTVIKKNTHKKFNTHLNVECGSHALNLLAMGLSLILLYSYGQTRVCDRRSSRPPAKPLGLCFFQFCNRFPDAWTTYRILLDRLHRNTCISKSWHNVLSPSFSTPLLTCACIRKPATGGLPGRRRPLVHTYHYHSLFWQVNSVGHVCNTPPGTP